MKSVKNLSFFQTERSQSQWMNSSTLLDSQPSNFTTTHPAPRMTTRGIQKMSGLFDTGFTGVSSSAVTSVKRDLDTPEFVTLSASDIFTSLEKGTDIPSSLEGATGTELPILGDLDLGLEDPQFLEHFTDLSDFLFSGEPTELLTPEPVEFIPVLPKSEATVRESCKAIKRKASMAVDDYACHPPNTDHDDYVSKVKKPRLSSAAESDTDSLASSSTDNKELKYLERRKKNNIASRRSRQTRKQKFAQMEQQAVDLEISNAKLQERVEEMEKLTKLMKDILVKRMSGK